MKGIFIILLLLCISVPSFATTYYVDSSSSGGDSNNGTSSATPWQSIAKVNLLNTVPGDIILFKRGGRWDEVLTVKNAGTSSQHIKYGAYGTGNRPYISGGGYVTGFSLVSGNVYTTSATLQTDRGNNARVYYGTTELTRTTSSTPSLNQYYWSFSGSPGTAGASLSGTLRINIGKAPNSTDIEASIRRNGILCDKSYIDFESLNVGMHIVAIGQGTSQSNYVTLTDMYVHDASLGIYTGTSTSNNAQYWTVQDSFFINNGQVHDYAHQIYMKWGGNHVFQRNFFDGNNKSAYAFDLNACSNNIIRYNRSQDQTNKFVMFMNDGAGGSSNNQVYYNISYHDEGLVYANGTTHTNNKFWNNTVYDYTATAVGMDNSATLAEFKNNILWSTRSGSQVTYSWSPPSANNDLDSFNPLFVDAAAGDLHLQVGSPCRDYGTDVNLTVDYDGVDISSDSTPDIGALQYNGGILLAPLNFRFDS